MKDQLRYPIGRFEPREDYTEREIRDAISVIAATPDALRTALRGLDEGQLDTPYRQGGWTVRQVVHHLPDSHLNGYVRMKLALTERLPTIRPFDEKAWSELSDATADVELSLDLLDALHRRWVLLLRALDDGQRARRYVHPEDGELDLATAIALYAWHGRHHVAHVASLRARKGW